MAIPLSQSERTDAVLAEIVEEITNKFHAGEAVDVECYVEAHPELAEQLRQLAPALHVLADLGHSVASGENVAVLPTDVAAAELGQLGDFRLIREVGRGGMGVVYQAVQSSLNRRVALKVLPFAAALDAKQLQRFKNEAQAAAHLHHTHIVPVHAVGCERGVHYYAMQFIDGQTLAQVIADLRLQIADLPGSAERRPGPDDGLSPLAPTRPIAGLSTEASIQSTAYFRTVGNLAIQAAEALEHAHQLGIVHRDIKPANLLLEWRVGDTNAPVLWITDFGLAHCQSQAGLTMTGDLVGTLRYMSPEQALAKRHLVDHRTDIYSLGVTLYELLTLEPAYSGSDREELLRQIAFEEPQAPRQRNKRIPRELETIVFKMMEKSPEARYATVQEAADDLRRFLEDKPIRARRPTVMERVAKWGRRHPAVVWAAVLLVTVALIGSGVSTFLIRRQRDVAQANADRAEQILDTAYRSMDTVYLAWAEKRLPEAKELTAEDRQFLENALAFYGEFANQNSSQPKGRQKTAEAYLRVANIQAQLGQDVEAKSNYHRALEALRKLVAEYPSQPDYRFDLARCLSEMAYMSTEGAAWVRLEYHPLYFETMEENQDAFRQAIKIQEKLVAEDPRREDYQRALAESYSRFGGHLEDYYQRYGEAEKLFHSALSIFTKLAQKHPTVLIHRVNLCNAMGRLGGVLIGRLPEAERIFRQSLDRRKQLVADFPGEPSARICLACGYQDLAAIQATTGKKDDASKSLHPAVEIAAKLVAAFPSAREYQVNLADSYGRLAKVCYEMDRLQEAEEATQKALAMWESLARDNALILEYAFELSDQQLSLGILAFDRGETRTALALYNLVLDTVRKLLAKEPWHVRARRFLQHVLGQQAAALIVLGRQTELEQTYKELDQEFREAIESDPSVAFNWFCDGPLRLQQGDVEGYRQICREMLTRFSHAPEPSTTEMTAKTCLLRPDSVSDPGLVRQLANRAATGTEQRIYYRWFLLTQGMADYRAGEYAKAIERLNKSLSLAGDPRYRLGESRDPSLAGTAYVFLAMAHQQQGHTLEARHWLDQATRVIQQIGRKTGQIQAPKPGWGNWLRFMLVYPEAEELVRGQAGTPK
jgi:serine/threonine protein kinase